MMMIGLAAAALAAATPSPASQLVAEMTFTRDAPRPGVAGEIRVFASPEGAVFRVRLKDVSPGLHGFHVHAGGSCADVTNAAGEVIAAGGAGPHWDPQAAGVHRGPHGEGHLADLPRIEAGRDGRVALSLTAPRIDDISALRGRALVLHVGADTYSDTPEPLGGGGRRLACGVLS